MSGRSMRYRAAAARAAVAVMILAAIVVMALLPRRVSLSTRHTFNTSDEGWFAYGSGARVRVTNRQEHVREGSGALELEYVAGGDQPGSAVLLVTEGALADMQRLRFWVRSDDDTAVAVVLSERRPDGGDYIAWCWSPRQQWQLIELLPADFGLAESSTAARDSNGRLDLNHVQALGFFDLGQLFGGISQDPAYPLMLKTSSGTHYLHVDDLEVLSTKRTGPVVSPTRIGDPTRGFVSWITLGGASLTLSPIGHPLEEGGFESQYEQRPGKYVALAHGLGHLALADIHALTFDVASLRPATLMVYLEERNPGNDIGPRYSSTFAVSGGSIPSRQTLALADFAYDVTSPRDADSRLTPDRLKTISLVDVTGDTLSGPEKTTLWISPIEAVTQ